MSLAKALKNKIVGKVSDVMSAPARYKADKAKKTADYEVGVIKKHRELQSRPFVSSQANSSGVTGDTRTVAEYQRIKSKYSR